MSQLHVEVLQAARELIASRREEFVCLAIMKVSRRDTEVAANEIREHVHHLVHPYCVLDGWINRNRPDLQIYNCNDFGGKMQATRVAWIDEFLIPYWKDQP